MAVDSAMVPLGTEAAAFDLPTVDGGQATLGTIDAPVLVVMFLCNHCPYVRHVEGELGRITSEYTDRGVAFVGVCSNDPATQPDDAPARLVEQAARAGWSFPYAVDETQAVARSYRAACTPDFFVYGPDRRLAYRGAMDGSSPANGIPLTGADLRGALDRVLAGEDVPEPHRPSMGCSIKWRPGNEPG